MSGKPREKLTYANVVATLALFIAIGGTSAFAASQLGKNSVGPKQLKKNSVTTAKIKKGAVTAAKVKKGTLTGKQINSSTLGTVPTAQSAQTANSLAPSEAWHEVGTPGEPAFQHGWSNFGTAEPVAFYKDHDGIVHLKGHAAGGEPTYQIFQLPPGYRPASGAVLPFAVECVCEGKVAQLGLLHILGTFDEPLDGSVIPYNPPASQVNFSGITFRAES